MPFKVKKSFLLTNNFITQFRYENKISAKEVFLSQIDERNFYEFDKRIRLVVRE